MGRRVPTGCVESAGGGTTRGWRLAAGGHPTGCKGRLVTGATARPSAILRVRPECSDVAGSTGGLPCDRIQRQRSDVAHRGRFKPTRSRRARLVPEVVRVPGNRRGRADERRVGGGPERPGNGARGGWQPGARHGLHERSESGGELDEAELHRINKNVLARVFWDGRAFISSTSLHDTFALRMCVINHTTTWDDVRETLEDITRFGMEAAASAEASNDT